MDGGDGWVLPVAEEEEELLFLAYGTLLVPPRLQPSHRVESNVNLFRS